MNMKKRKQIYDTYSLYKRNIKMIYPQRFEACVRVMLYKYRVKNRKNFLYAIMILYWKHLIIAKMINCQIKN